MVNTTIRVANILIIDDEELIRESLAERIEKLGHNASKAATLQEGAHILESGLVDLVFLDINLPDGNGLESLPAIRQSPSSPEVIIITAVGSSEGAALAIQNGAWDYITKPFKREEVILLIERTIEYRRAKQKYQQKPVVIEASNIIGKSRAVKECIAQVAHCAGGDANVLVTGETGTGKELFARAVHDNHPGMSGEYVVVDCAALPETLMESVLFGYVKGAFTGADKNSEGLIKKANGGTLFLDEVGELPLSMQKTFLRVLQEKRFRPVGNPKEINSNFRLISATNRNLIQMVEEGSFRQDLYHRLKTISISVPPLRERREDISLLAQHYIPKLCTKHSLPAKVLPVETLEILEHYNWPGNIRELVNALEKALLSERVLPIIYPMFLPQEIRIDYTSSKLKVTDKAKISSAGTSSYTHPIHSKLYSLETIPELRVFREEALQEVETIYLKSLLNHCDWNIEKSIQVSGLSKSRLYALISRYGLKQPIN